MLHCKKQDIFGSSQAKIEKEKGLSNNVNKKV